MTTANTSGDFDGTLPDVFDGRMFHWLIAQCYEQGLASLQSPELRAARELAEELPDCSWKTSLGAKHSWHLTYPAILQAFVSTVRAE